MGATKREKGGKWSFNLQTCRMEALFFFFFFSFPLKAFSDVGPVCHQYECQRSSGFSSFSQKIFLDFFSKEAKLKEKKLFFSSPSFEDVYGLVCNNGTDKSRSPHFGGQNDSIAFNRKWPQQLLFKETGADTRNYSQRRGIVDFYSNSQTSATSIQLTRMNNQFRTHTKKEELGLHLNLRVDMRRIQFQSKAKKNRNQKYLSKLLFFFDSGMDQTARWCSIYTYLQTQKATSRLHWRGASLQNPCSACIHKSR